MREVSLSLMILGILLFLSFASGRAQSALGIIDSKLSAIQQALESMP